MVCYLAEAAAAGMQVDWDRLVQESRLEESAVGEIKEGGKTGQSQSQCPTTRSSWVSICMNMCSMKALSPSATGKVKLRVLKSPADSRERTFKTSPQNAFCILGKIFTLLSMHAAIEAHGNGGVNAVKRALPDTSYGHIKLVAAMMKCKAVWFAEHAAGR